jgi:UDP-N-acetylglucosamine acyltransferase
LSLRGVHPTAIVEDGAELAPGVEVGPYAVIGPHVRIGPGCRILSHAVVVGRTTMGAENVIHSHAVVGGAPQDLKYRGEETELRIGDRNQIREGVTINAGTVQGGGATLVGSDNLLMTGAHVAHDCRLGDRIVLANVVMLGGHVCVQDGAIMNGGAGVHHFATVGRLAYVGGLARVTSDIPPFTIVEGHPGRPRAVNVVGMKRAGIPAPRILALKEAFKALFRGEAPVRECLGDLEARFAEHPEVLELVRFVRAMAAGRHGRQQEPLGRKLA